MALFQKDVKQPGAGRPKGTPNESTLAMKAAFAAHADESVERIVWLAKNGETHAVQLAAATAIADRAWGRPTQHVAESEGGAPIFQFTTIYEG